MEGSIAHAAIQSILNACDEQTRNEVMKGIRISESVPVIRKRPLITNLQAREDLIRKHFNQ